MSIEFYFNQFIHSFFFFLPIYSKEENQPVTPGDGGEDVGGHVATSRSPRGGAAPSESGTGVASSPPCCAPQEPPIPRQVEVGAAVQVCVPRAAWPPHLHLSS